MDWSKLNEDVIAGRSEDRIIWQPRIGCWYDDKIFAGTPLPEGYEDLSLPYARETGLDGIEAITPLPQGDVTLEEMKAGLGDDLFLLDGISAVLFDKEYPLDQLIDQTKKVIDLFAPKLILGISDEISSTGDIERVKIVGNIVEEYNKSQGAGN